MRVYTILVVLAIVSCSAAVANDNTVLPTGTWGGPDVQVIVTSQGATAQFACAHGTIGQLIADANGNFAANGTYVYEHPANPLSNADSHSAHYDGQLAGTTMRVAVTVPDKQDVFGPFTAMLGTTGPATRCP